MQELKLIKISGNRRPTTPREEIIELLGAILFTPLYRDVIIYTDSEYAVFCVTMWCAEWKENDWIDKDGNAIEDKDIIIQILDVVKRRNEAGSRSMFEIVRSLPEEGGVGV